MDTDIDPRDLSEVRRRIVDPVVQSLLKPDEFDDVALEIKPVYVAPPEDSYGLLIGRIWARDELVTYWEYGVPDDDVCDAEFMAADLYDHLQMDLPESKFAWGERLRHGEYVIPGPSRG